MNIKDMKCCDNCKNHYITDGGTLQCLKGRISDYNYATCPQGEKDYYKNFGYRKVKK